MPSDTRTALGQNAERCESRSLYMDRFANPAAKDSGNLHPRRDWFTALLGKGVVRSASESRHEWLASAAASGSGRIFYAQLQSRLMVNMAGGVMENAGLCLDRFGLPFLPGSAVKGCARRMAIQTLMEASELGQSVGDIAQILADIAFTFGWGDTEWKPGRRERVKPGQRVAVEAFSDFWWAMAPDSGDRLADDGQRDIRWGSVAEIAAELLFARLPGKAGNRTLPLADQLPGFAGAVSFLPAYAVDFGKSGLVPGLPVELPPLGKLELDVLTCHHGKYYSAATDRSGQLSMPVALDTEEPVPVVFPTVAAGHVFAFALLPRRNCPQPLLGQATIWLAGGLSVCGLGAKTAAGYGWFETSDQTSQLVAKFVAKQASDRAEHHRATVTAAAQRAREEAERQQRDQRSAVLASLTPEQQEDYKLAQLSDDQFRSALENFAGKSAEEQKAIVRALRLDPVTAGSRRSWWDDLKAKAQKKGGKQAQTEQAIRLLSKQTYQGKEGKMP